MPAADPYGKILENKVMTATGEELILMLYDGAIKFGNQALAAMEKRDYYGSNLLIVRMEDIIRELQLSLNNTYDISKNFNQLYDYMYRRLVEANLESDVGKIKEVIDLFREFRDMWKEAMKLAKQQQKAPQSE